MHKMWSFVFLGKQACRTFKYYLDELQLQNIHKNYNSCSITLQAGGVKVTTQTKKL
jgi:hypothetical protein